MDRIALLGLIALVTATAGSGIAQTYRAFDGQTALSLSDRSARLYCTQPDTADRTQRCIHTQSAASRKKLRVTFVNFDGRTGQVGTSRTEDCTALEDAGKYACKPKIRILGDKATIVGDRSRFSANTRPLPELGPVFR